MYTNISGLKLISTEVANLYLDLSGYIPGQPTDAHGFSDVLL